MIDKINDALKHVLVTLCAIIIAALTLATGYVPAVGIAAVLWKFMVVPVLAGIIALCASIIKNNSDK